MNKIFTIGHSTNLIDDFLSLLVKHKIDTIVDVRSVPYSRYSSQFNKESLIESLKSKHIKYISMGDCLGARYDDVNMLSNDGKVDFLKISETDLFQDGISRLTKGMEKGYRIALMCSEKNPIECHRFSLISQYLHNQQIDVQHIIGDEIFEHGVIEKKLLEYYVEHHKISLDIEKIKNYNMFQESLFGIDKKILYSKINKLIAYDNTERESL